ncbi:hypothetical protein SBOR_2978 [Sclerotinia borealis F-4128]|uniref:Uncharacterized protein n=1 Tax=Sclerotinia borealis (strain F-4128) TaxID=1432307 RepID=W9CL79_SCLBF|nr:hypothetical protein SBOR_2978 [Sclerotinia borealis F-4128]
MTDHDENVVEVLEHQDVHLLVPEDDHNQEDVEPIAFFGMEQHCLLCRAPFNQCFRGFPIHCEVYEEWEPDLYFVKPEFRAVVRFSTDQGDQFALTKAFRGGYEPNENMVSLVGWPPLKKISIEPRPELNVPANGFTPCFHESCYWTLNPTDLSSHRWDRRLRGTRAEVLYRLSISLRISSTWGHISESIGELYPRSDCDTLLSIAPESSQIYQPFFLSKLPPELRCKIWSFVKRGPAYYYKSMMVVGETHRLLSLTHDSTNHGFEELSIEPGCYIEATIESIYSTEYIRNLSIHKTSISGIHIPEAITEVQFISSVHGICAMRFSGSGSNWKSKWLGTVPLKGRTWHGRISITTDILFCYFNFLSLDEIADKSQRNIRQVMWDCLDHPGPSEGRLTGIETHFATISYLSGHRSKVSTHFPLGRSERLSNVWVRMRLETFGGSQSSLILSPCLLIRTTIGREYTFGSYVDPIYYDDHNWVFMAQGRSVTGLYYENPPGQFIMKLAVVGKRKILAAEVTPPLYKACSPILPIMISDCLRGWPHEIYMTDATFEDLRMVLIRRVGRHISGMFIQYMDSDRPPAVLGEWAASEHGAWDHQKNERVQSSEHCCIYDSTKATPSTVVFIIHWVVGYIHEIFFCNRDSDRLKVEVAKGGKLKAFDMGTRVSWWFGNFTDVIQPWTEENPRQSLSVPEDRIIKELQ